jgi:hypothetical protein
MQELISKNILIDADFGTVIALEFLSKDISKCKKYHRSWLSVIFQTVWKMSPCRFGATVAIPQNIIAISTDFHQAMIVRE